MKNILVKFLVITIVTLLLPTQYLSANTEGNESNDRRNIIRLVFEMEPSETKYIYKDGEQIAMPVFDYDPREKIKDQLKKDGFRLVSQDSKEYDVTLYVTHKEKKRPDPVSGKRLVTVVSQLSTELKDKNGITLFKEGISADYWESIDDAIDTFILKSSSRIGDHFGVDVIVNWLPQESGTEKSLNSVYFIDERNGWVVGDGGTILKTADGGNTWISKKRFDDRRILMDVHFVNENEGWVVGSYGAVLKTTDGGRTWISQKQSVKEHLVHVNQRLKEDLVAVDFVNSKKGWVVGGYGTVLTTSDGGISWNLQIKGAKPSSGQAYFGAGLNIIDDSNGWIVGNFGSEGEWQRYGTVLRTVDGGNNWLTQKSTSDGDGRGSGYLYNIHFFDEKTGWVFSGKGTLLKTSDGGDTWVSQKTPPQTWMDDGDFVDAKVGWLVGAKGAILHTSDGGLTWVMQETGTRQRLSNVHFIDENNGWAIGSAGTILQFHRQ